MWSDASWYHLQQSMERVEAEVVAFRALMASKGREGLLPEDARAALTREGGLCDTVDSIWGPIYWDLPAHEGPDA